jgi:hypothetical protein
MPSICELRTGASCLHLTLRFGFRHVSIIRRYSTVLGSCWNGERLRIHRICIPRLSASTGCFDRSAVCSGLTKRSTPSPVAGQFKYIYLARATRRSTRGQPTSDFNHHFPQYSSTQHLLSCHALCHTSYFYRKHRQSCNKS